MLVILVNPQVCMGYFSVSLPLYDGDTIPAVVDRIRRVSSIPGQSHDCHMMSLAHAWLLLGNVRVELLRYKIDARSIPSLGEDSGVVVIGATSRFSVNSEGNLVLNDPGNGNETVAVGTHMQYKVCTS